MDVSSHDVLLVGGGGNIRRVDIASGRVTDVAAYPAGTFSSGDLAFVEGRLVATASAGGTFSTDVLVEVDLTSGTSRVLGETGFGCIWGLAAYGAALYGLTCGGLIVRIDSRTGAATMFSSSTGEFWGAAAR